MVIGMGENKTPEPFRKACDKFTILENLMSEQNPGTSKSETTHDRRSKEKIEDAIIKMIIENQDINKPTGLGEVGAVWSVFTRTLMCGATGIICCPSFWRNSQESRW